MKTALPLLLTSLALAGCCCDKEQHVDAEPTMPIAETDVPIVETGRVLNWSKLDAVPSPVRYAFLSQFPEAGITSVKPLNAVTGRLVYQINYVDASGVPGQVMYFMDGTRVTQPGPAPEPEIAPPASPGGAPALQ